MALVTESAATRRSLRRLLPCPGKEPVWPGGPSEDIPFPPGPPPPSPTPERDPVDAPETNAYRFQSWLILILKFHRL